MRSRFRIVHKPNDKILHVVDIQSGYDEACAIVKALRYFVRNSTKATFEEKAQIVDIARRLQEALDNPEEVREDL